jgi:hypothetical protein
MFSVSIQKMTLKEMREELRALRKAQDVRPISRMKKGDISEEIEKLKLHRESTPPVAAFVSAPTQVSRSAVKSIKEAKKMEFPVEHSGEKEAPAVKKAPKAKAVAKVAPKARKAPEVEKPEAQIAKFLAMMKTMNYE